MTRRETRDADARRSTWGQPCHRNVLRPLEARTPDSKNSARLATGHKNGNTRTERHSQKRKKKKRTEMDGDRHFDNRQDGREGDGCGFRETDRGTERKWRGAETHVNVYRFVLLARGLCGMYAL